MPFYERDPVQIAQPVLVRAEPIGRESEQYFSSFQQQVKKQPNEEHDSMDARATAFSIEQDILLCLNSLKVLLSARCGDLKAIDHFLKMLLEMEEHVLCEHKDCLLPLLLECMGQFPHKTSLQKHCLCLLHAIPKDDCHDCIRWVLAALRNHALSDHVQWYGCLLCESWMSTEIFGAFCAEGGIESVISAAKALGECSGNMRRTCRSIFWQLNEISKEGSSNQASDHDYQGDDYGLYRSLVRFRLSKYNWEGTSNITVEV
jgi:hypothetical protein